MTDQFDPQHEIHALEKRIEAKLVAQEHRLIPIIKHLLYALKNGIHQKEALYALLVYIISPRTAVVTTLTFGGILAFFIAVEANELLAVQNELAEGQRRASVNIELSNVLDLVYEETKPYFDYCNGNLSKEESKDFSKIECEDTHANNIMFSVSQIKIPNYWLKSPKELFLSQPLSARVSALTQALRPYRYLKTSDNQCDNQKTWLERLAHYIAGWILTNPVKLGCQNLSPLTSPERGQILIALAKSKIVLSSDFIFDYANLDNQDLSFANFYNAQLNSASFRNAELIDANFKNASLNYTDFKNANLHSAKFDNSNLVGTFFNSSKLMSASFKNAFWAFVSIEDVLYLRTSKLHEACIIGDDLEYLLENFPDLVDYKPPDECRKRLYPM